MRKPRKQQRRDGSGLNFDAQLWATADRMRGHMDASEYKHVCLGGIFLKYISDAFEEKREQLLFGWIAPSPRCETHYGPNCSRVRCVCLGGKLSHHQSERNKPHP